MNCFQFRRLLLVEPRQLTPEQRAHRDECASCARLVRGVEQLEERLQKAALVPVPEGLAERVLLRHKIHSPNRWSTLALAERVLLGHKIHSPNRWGMLALAASLLVAVGVAFHFHEAPRQSDEMVSAQRLGENQHAMAAISYVLDHEPQLLRENRTGDPKVMRAALSKLGLSLPANIGSVRYLGKGLLPDGSTGEHIVLQTLFGHVTLILMPDVFLASRVVASDRNMQAVVSPSRSGCYILIAESSSTLKRIEAMLM